MVAQFAIAVNTVEGRGGEGDDPQDYVGERGGEWGVWGAGKVFAVFSVAILGGYCEPVHDSEPAVCELAVIVGWHRNPP